MKKNIIPSRYHRAVIAHIKINGAADAIVFYKKALGATEVFRIEKSNKKILHSEIKIEGSIVMVGDADEPPNDPKALHGTTVKLHVYVKDVDALFLQAIAAGAKEIQAVQDMFYGDRQGILEDPFGHIWVLLTHKEDITPEEFKKRGEAMMRKKA